MLASPASRPVEAPASRQDLVDQRGADDVRQELVDDDPLVVPRDEPARFGEHDCAAARSRGSRRTLRIGRRRRVFGLFVVVDATAAGRRRSARSMSTTLVVEAQEGRLQPADDDVLVVPRVGDDRGAARGARQIFEAAFGGLLDLELHAVGSDRTDACRRSGPARRPSRDRSSVSWSWAIARAASRRRVAMSRRTSCRDRGTGRRTSRRRSSSDCRGCSR